MNTATRARPHRISEGTATAQVINAMPRPLLLDTSEPAARAPHHTPPKLRLIKLAAKDGNGACGFGTCALDPECTAKCRYREADRALRSHYSDRHTQRAAMPPAPRPKANPLARRITWALIALWCVGWIVGPIAWWLFA